MRTKGLGSVSPTPKCGIEISWNGGTNYTKTDTALLSLTLRLELVKSVLAHVLPHLSFWELVMASTGWLTPTSTGSPNNDWAAFGDPTRAFVEDDILISVNGAYQDYADLAFRHFYLVR